MNALPTLEALYQLGRRICSEVERFQPDLIRLPMTLPQRQFVLRTCRA